MHMIYQHHKKQLGAALLLFWLIIALCLSLVFMVAHAHHDCQGERCSVCLHIGQAASTLRSFAATGVLSLLSQAYRLMPVAAHTGGAFIRCPAEQSLVSLRTRMND